ncbi:MAG: hypothetical protein WC956_04990 [bacterium]
MKGTAYALIAVIALATLSACSDKGSNDTPPLPDVSALTVSQEALAGSVWGTATEASPDADCLASSSFKIAPDKGFDIVKIYEKQKTGRMEPKVLVVTNIDISFADASTDGRGAACGEGSLGYTVVASDETPIEIEVATSLKSRQSLNNIAKEGLTAYPKCEIVAHFDKAGTVVCGTTDEPAEVTPETPPADQDGDANADDGKDDGKDNDRLIAIPGRYRRIGTLDNLSKAATVNDDGIPCGTEEVHTIKLVVDDVNCRMLPTKPAAK